MHRGTIQEFLTNHHDDVDGLRLDDGFETHFPPHIGRQVAQLFESGADIEIEGRNVDRADGRTVYEATLLRSGEERIVIDRPKLARAKKSKDRHEVPMSATGTIARFHTNHHGDTDGFELTDGTEVKFPPHLGEALAEFADVGDALQIEGRRHLTPHGDVHLHADRLVSIKTGSYLEREGPHEHRRPKHKGDDSHNEPSNTDLLRELKAIRQLLEALQK